MKPTTGTVIKALRSGLATRDELLEHHACASEALTTCTSNMLRRELISRYAETVDGKMVSAYRLTELGKAWKPDQRGKKLVSAMQKGKAKQGKGPADGPLIDEGTTDSARIATQAMKAVDFTAPELQYLAPEDYAMPEPDAKLLALANRELSAQLDAWREMARRFGHTTPHDLREFLDATIAAFDVNEERNRLASELDNATALADKLQHLLDAKTRECEALRANAPECCGECAPDLETVALVDLLARVATYLDDGQTVTIHASDLVTINAFGRNFVGTYLETSGLLDASAMLRRAEVAA